MENGKIYLAHKIMRFKSAAQGKIGVLRLRKHHYAACLGVEPMDNTRTRIAAHSRHRGEMGKRSVHQRA